MSVPKLREKVLDSFHVPIEKAVAVPLNGLSPRTTTLCAIGLAIAVGCSQPNPRSTFRVASSSMAPAFHGPCLLLPCSHCGTESLVAAEVYRPTLPTRCSICGGTCAAEGAGRDGEIVQVVPLESGSGPSRFAAIAIKLPGIPQEVPAPEALREAGAGERESLTLKRVWGLPGEQLAIQDGELWVNGQLYQKGLEELEQLAIPVARLSANALEQTDSSHLVWTYRRPARVDVQHMDSTLWLTESYLLDDYPFNQGISRPLNTVRDYLVKIRWQKPITQSCILLLSNGQTQVQLDVRCLPQHSASQQGKGNSIDVVQRLDVACCDGRLLVRSDVERWECGLQELDSPATSPWFSIELDSTDVLADCEIYRDLYLFAESGVGEIAAWAIPKDSYFVMGDNLPVSVDSRNGLGLVLRSDIVGGVQAYRVEQKAWLVPKL